MVYINPTTLQSPKFSIPRNTILAVDSFAPAADGPWLHVFNMTNSNSPTSLDGSISHISSFIIL